MPSRLRQALDNGDMTRPPPLPALEKQPSQPAAEEDSEDGEDGGGSSSDSDEEELSPEERRLRERAQKDSGTAGKESQAGAEISALVNYVQPGRFHSFWEAERELGWSGLAVTTWRGHVKVGDPCSISWCGEVPNYAIVEILHCGYCMFFC